MGNIPVAATAADFHGYTLIHNQGIEKWDNEYLNPEIKNKADNITNGKLTSFDKCKAIFNWVKENIYYSYYTNSQKGPVETLESGEGNCCDQTRLQITLVRSLNLTDVQEYFVYSEVYYYHKHKTVGHVWALYDINGTLEIADSVNRDNAFGKPSKHCKILEKNPRISQDLWM